MPMYEHFISIQKWIIQFQMWQPKSHYSINVVGLLLDGFFFGLLSVSHFASCGNVWITRIRSNTFILFHIFSPRPPIASQSNGVLYSELMNASVSECRRWCRVGWKMSAGLRSARHSRNTIANWLVNAFHSVPSSVSPHLRRFSKYFVIKLPLQRVGEHSVQPLEPRNLWSHTRNIRVRAVANFFWWAIRPQI